MRQRARVRRRLEALEQKVERPLEPRFRLRSFVETMEKIGKYELLEKIGTGGFGVVYKGRDPFIKRFVAVKTCSSESEEMRRRFFREAEIAGNLHHRNVTTVYDFGFQGDVPYLVQEFLSGEDLDQVIKRKSPLSDHVKVGYLVQAAAGLDYAHSQGVIHRDVKPSNIRVLDTGRIKIMDFGIAKLSHVESQLTQTGMTLGTSSYLAPEQIKGEDVSAAVDVFSFGVVAYELLTFQRPFQGETISSLFYKILSHEPEPIQVLWTACDEDLAAVVHRCLAKEPGERFESMAALLEELSPIEERLRIQASDSDRLPTRSMPLPVDDASRTAILPKGPSDDEISSLGKRVDELLGAGNPTAAEVEVTLARKRHGTGSGFDSAVAPILDKIARTRKSRDDERRRGEKLQALLERSRELEEEDHYEEALLVLRTARDMDPESEEAAERLAALEAKAESARREREREEKAQEVSRLLQEGELAGARESLESLAADPDASPALVDPLQDRLGRAERRQEAAALTEEARAAREEGRLEDGLELARKARDIVPGDDALVQLISEIESEIQRRQEADRRELKRQEAERQVRAALAAGEVAAARSLLQAAERELPEQEGWAALREDLDRLETQRSEERERALDRLTRDVEGSLEAADFDGARRQLQRSRLELGQDERLAALSASIDEAEALRRREEADDLLDQANEALEAEDLQTARDLLERVESLGVDETRPMALRARLEEIEAERERERREAERAEALAVALGTIEGHLGDDRYDEARRVLLEARRDLGPDERWDELETEIEGREVALRREELEEILAWGSSALAAGDLREARRRWDEAKRIGLSSPELEAFGTELEAAEAEKARREEEERREAAIADATASIGSALEAGELRSAEKALTHARAEWPGEAAWDELGERLDERRRAIAEERRARREAILKSPALRYGALAAGLVLVAALGFQLWPERPEPGDEIAAETALDPEGTAADRPSIDTDPDPAPWEIGDDPPVDAETEGIASESTPADTSDVATQEATPAGQPPPGPSAEALDLGRRAEQALRSGRTSEALDHALGALALEPELGAARDVRDRIVRQASANAETASREADRSRAGSLAPGELRRAVDKRDEARAAERAGRHREAFRAFAESATLFRRAGETAQQEADRRAAAQAPTTPAEEAEEVAAPAEVAAEPPAAEPPSDPRQQVQELLQAYVTAMESRSFAAVQRVFPSVPPAMREPLEGYRSLEMALTNCSISVDGDDATARCAMNQVVMPPTGAAQRLERGVRFAATRSGDRWLITGRTFE